MKTAATLLLGMAMFVAYAGVARAAGDTTLQHQIDIDLNKVCLYEDRAYSLGAKIQFTYNRPISGLVAQEVLECLEANAEKKGAGAYWKTYSISCKNPTTNKSEGCM